ncbi:unnamed protein product [Phytophthora lilii]|uniref:Unnamed protein product n=1 Tax=Phytophthora lilii TaxID=2077276 RepID=A0A9W6WUE2_9STRA|nr:unnamed protein product [Phytophthora lilii]
MRPSIEANCNTTQEPLEAGSKSFSAFASTPYIPQELMDPCRRSLHPTNRSLYEREKDRHKHWFVTKNPHLRECYSEFLGTYVMIAFGMGVNNQVVLSEDKEGTWLSINMAWGIAVLMGVYCSRV